MTDDTVAMLFIFYMSFIAILGGRIIIQEIAWSKQAEKELQQKLTKLAEENKE